MTVKHGVLIHRPTAAPGPVDATLTINRTDFLAGLTSRTSLISKIVDGAGSMADFARFAALLSPLRMAFPIVTPSY